MRALDLPETEAPHLGVSSGGVEVEGVTYAGFFSTPLGLGAGCAGPIQTQRFQSHLMPASRSRSSNRSASLSTMI